MCCRMACHCTWNRIVLRRDQFHLRFRMGVYAVVCAFTAMNLSMMVGGSDQLEFFLAPPINFIEALSKVTMNTPVAIAVCANFFLATTCGFSYRFVSG